MPQSALLRLLVTATALFLAVAVVWWALGFQLGKGVLEELKGGAAFRRAYGFEESNVLALFALAFSAVVSLALYQGAGGGKLMWLSAGAIGAGLLLGGAPAGMLGAAVTVFAVGAASEVSGTQRLIAAGIGALVASFVFAIPVGLDGGAWAAAWAIRAVFYFFPLVFGAGWLSENLPRWLKASSRA